MAQPDPTSAPRLPLLLYSLAWWLALPLVLVRLWWRGRREPGYRRHVGERLGHHAAGTGNALQPVLWVHAVSVGETRAAQPLIEALLAEWPQHRLLLTHMTPTGRATGAALFQAIGFASDGAVVAEVGSPLGHPLATGRLLQCYLPYDTGFLMRRFLRHWHPAVCILIETEVWPNLVAQCRRASVPVLLASARLSARSLARGKRFPGLLGAAAQALSATGAQTPADAARLQEMGAAPVSITGSLKFDVVPPAPQVALGRAWRSQLGARPVLLCASTRDGEEELILDAWAVLPVAALLVIVPRHPQRFDAVAGMISARGLRMARRSTLGVGVDGADDADHADVARAASMPGADVDVLLGDSMGEMYAYLAAADVAFIGGSLMPLGGQNLIEACAVGTPVLIGPSSFNFAAVTEEAIEAGAALQVEDAPAMLATARALLQDAAVRGAMSRAALAFATQHRGATARTVDLLRPLIGA